MRPIQAHCHHGLGTLYTRTGQQELARAALSMAIEMYRAMEMTFWLGLQALLGVNLRLATIDHLSNGYDVL